MLTSTIQRNKTMLYCPKCNATYEDDSQKLCLNDGGRLLPAPSSIKAAANSQGVFASILKNTPEKEETGKSAPRIFVADPVEDERNNFHSNLSSKIFKDEKSPRVSEQKDKFQVLKPLAEVFGSKEVLPAADDQDLTLELPEIAAKTEDLPIRKPAFADARISKTEPISATKTENPAVQSPISRRAIFEKPENLINEMVSDRYLIVDILDRNDSRITYLAEDKNNDDKEVMVGILMKDSSDNFLSNIFAEERISLSQLSHPNLVRVTDSGDLPEGNPFVVTELIDGFSVREKLEVVEKFEPGRAAKIVRETSYALSELHQNGVLHCNLRPDNIFLTINDNNTEQVKVTDFAVSVFSEGQDAESIKYQSPEQLEGRLPNYASDIFSLAVITYEMLTGKFPFEFTTAEDLRKAHKRGLTVKITAQPFNLPPIANVILEKALSYPPSSRYAKARDFGDAMFQALTATPFKNTNDFAPFNKPPVNVEPVLPLPIVEPPIAPVSESPETKSSEPEKVPVKPKLIKESDVINPADLAWEKRSPEPLKKGNNSWLWMAGAGILIVLLASWIIWHYALNRQQTPEQAAAQVTPVTPPKPDPTIVTAIAKSSPTPAEVESPLPRTIEQPANTEIFQNSDGNLKGDLAKNFLGFSLYYPKDWEKNASSTNFIDVSKTAESGTPVEQFLVSYYKSQGTAKLDSKRFPSLVQDSSKKLSKIIANYRLVSRGEKIVNNDLNAYEMKFQGAGTTANGDKINLWGRRLFIPAENPKAKNGFVITMLATSLSPDVKGVDDVGVKGETAKILETFKPSAQD